MALSASGSWAASSTPSSVRKRETARGSPSLTCRDSTSRTPLRLTSWVRAGTTSSRPNTTSAPTATSTRGCSRWVMTGVAVRGRGGGCGGAGVGLLIPLLVPENLACGKPDRRALQLAAEEPEEHGQVLVLLRL